MPTIPPAEHDWQTGKSLPECALYMLENQVACDVTFLLGKDKKEIPAHRFILMSRSPVFYAMFCGPMAETQTQIPVPDIEPQDFQILLRYMYSDEIKANSKTALGVMSAAKKYGVTGLIKPCRELITENLDVDNACFYLSYAESAGEHGMFDTLLAYVLENGECCLKSSSFSKMNRPCVERVVEADDLQARELSVWESLVTWSEAECERRGESITGENIRKNMAGLAYSVRFSGITPEEYTKTITSREILTAQETISIFKFYNGAVKPEKFTSKSGRTCTTSPQASKDSCFTRFGEVSYGWTCSGQSSDNICFSVSKAVILKGMVLYGCSSPSQYQIRAILTDGAINEFLNRTEDTVPGKRTFDVRFEQSIRLQRNTIYTLSVRIKGEASFNGRLGQQSITEDGVTFTFKDCSNKGNGTDVSGGQIPGLIFQRVL